MVPLNTDSDKFHLQESLDTFTATHDRLNPLSLSRCAAGMLVFFIFISGILLSTGPRDYPQLHTILDACMALLSGIATLLLWDVGTRFKSSFTKYLALTFAAVFLYQFIHLMAAVDWQGHFAPIAQGAGALRPSTWPPPAYILPIGIGLSLYLLGRGTPVRTITFALGLIALGIAFSIIFHLLPRYVPPTWLGITRPTLILIPPLWILVGWMGWHLHVADRVIPTLTHMSIVFFLASVSMLYSRSPHDTQAMVAHLGMVSGYMMLLFTKLLFGSQDMLARIQTEQKFRGLLESAPDAIVIVNSEGKVVLVNSQAEKLFGYARDDLMGQKIEMLLPERYRHSHPGHRDSFFADPRVRPMGVGLELYGLRKNGTEFPIEISLSPLETEEGTLVSSAIRDVTEHKLFQHALQEKNIELENANQAKDNFLANMSHELRTPLNAIIGFTGTLLMKLPGPLNKEQDKQLRTVQTSAKHLLALINDLLDVAKIEAGKVELNLAIIDCSKVLEEIAAPLRHLAEAKGLSFKTTLSEQPLTLYTDQRALSQIIINLANNAIKFTEQGSVIISLLRRQVRGNKIVEISVTDTGIGINADDQAKLFKAFERLDISGRQAKEGTGLGLHLSQKLAQTLGGKITVRSKLSTGSTFSLILPER